MRLTMGQYLAPSKNHAPVARYIPPEEFEMWGDAARRMGFASVASGPLVRSSYRAEEMVDAGPIASGDQQIRKVS
jgi:lipoic acid synthetase